MMLHLSTSGSPVSLPYTKADLEISIIFFFFYKTIFLLPIIFHLKLEATTTKRNRELR